jgi:hypothetical protein
VAERRRLLDFLRKRLTSGLDVDTSGQAPRRGEEIEALVTITGRPGKLGDVEVGLLCTEYYDEERTSTDSEGHTDTYSVTCDAIAYEAWLPVETAVGVQSVRFPIPPTAPFSYEGDCLSFKWEIVARGHRPHRLDAQASHDLSVLP